MAWLRGIAVFYQFGLTYMDRLWHLHYGRKLKWQPIGEQNLMALQQEDGGALIFTVHSGNYDIGTSLFAEKLGHAVYNRAIYDAQALIATKADEMAEALYALERKP